MQYVSNNTWCNSLEAASRPGPPASRQPAQPLTIQSTEQLSDLRAGKQRVCSVCPLALLRKLMSNGLGRCWPRGSRRRLPAWRPLSSVPDASSRPFPRFLPTRSRNTLLSAPQHRSDEPVRISPAYQPHPEPPQDPEQSCSSPWRLAATCSTACAALRPAPGHGADLR